MDNIPPPCACMGPIGDDPYCPCTMKQRGLTPTDIWTDEAKQQFADALTKIFKKRADKDENK